MMTNEQQRQCEFIIHSAAVASAAIGGLPVPGSDAVGLVGIQTGMVLALANVFGYPMTKAAAEHVAKQAVVSSTGKLIATSLVKVIPGVGSVVCASVAAGLTEVFGWDQAREFAAAAKLPSPAV
jgi:uncharacterized protein (DUF697 family)